MVDLFLKGQLRSLNRLPIDCAREIVGAVALIFLEQNFLSGYRIAARGQARALEDVLEYAKRKVTVESGSRVRLVSVMRRTVLYMNGDCFTCGHA